MTSMNHVDQDHAAQSVVFDLHHQVCDDQSWASDAFNLGKATILSSGKLLNHVEKGS